MSPSAYAPRTGLTATELGDHFTDREQRETLAAMFDRIPALTAQDIAEVVASPPRAQVNCVRIELLPARQA